MDGNDTLKTAYEAIQYIPTRPDYETWLKVIAAVGNEFDEVTALQILLSRFKDETPDQHRRKLATRLSNVNFGTLVFEARKNGYTGVYRGNNGNWQPAPQRPPIKPEIQINFDPAGIRYRFTNEVFEEYAAILEYDSGLTRHEAESQVIAENKLKQGIDYERLYYVSINKNVLNKNCNPKTGQPYKDYSNLTNGFKSELMSKSELIASIAKGYPFICGHVTGQRCKANWHGSDLLSIDVDRSLKMEDALNMPEIKAAAFLYTSYRHTPDSHRFRIVMPLPGFIHYWQEYEALATRYIDIFRADKNCKDAARAFYGNWNTTIYDLMDGCIYEYKKGEKVDER